MNELRFGFGKNWKDFIEKNLSDERVGISQKCLLDFLGLQNLEGLSFLDIGCGSGIHSYAAFKAGARKIISFDYDPDSVNTTRVLWEYAGKPDHWQVLQGSVLDKDFMAPFQGMDIVYSWGVLHHTGSMWQAITNACELAGPNSLVYLALYTDDFMEEPSGFWLKIKHRYNTASPMRKKLMELWYIWKYMCPGRHIFKLPGAFVLLKRSLAYKQSRGMNFYTDVKDWLGGWPMEWAGTTQAIRFCCDKFGFQLINLATGEANSEYLFKKREGRVLSVHAEPAGGERAVLEPPFNYVGGHCYSTDISHLKLVSDSPASPKASTVRLFEDDQLCCFNHSLHKRIIEVGQGSYSHWNGTLYFSTPDNSNPNNTGKRYSITCSK